MPLAWYGTFCHKILNKPDIRAASDSAPIDIDRLFPAGERVAEVGHGVLAKDLDVLLSGP